MACLIRVPTEVLKLHIQTGRTGSIRQSITHVISHEGFGGFFKGFSTTIMREVVFLFSIYSHICADSFHNVQFY